MKNPKLETISFDTIAKAVKNCTTPSSVQSFSNQERLFLIDWLSDDLDLAIENKDTSSNYLINKLKSVIKKLTEGK